MLESVFKSLVLPLAVTASQVTVLSSLLNLGTIDLRQTASCELSVKVQYASENVLSAKVFWLTINLWVNSALAALQCVHIINLE